MTEIPEHLLKRSKAAKSSETGKPKEASAESAVAKTSAATPAETTVPAKASAALPNLDPEPKPPKPEPHYIKAAKARKKVPVWALPVIAALPIWAVGYAGTLQQPEVEDPLFVESAILYSNNCAGCHGGGGGGVSGYQLSGGSVWETFPQPIDQMAHIARGSSAIQGEGYGAERADGQRVAGDLGQMPQFGDSLSQVELEMITFHERAVLSEEDTSTPAYEEWMESMRERYEADDAEPIELEALLTCADPEMTPGGSGEAGDEENPCPGPSSEEGEAAAE